MLCFLVGEGIGRYFGLCDYPLYTESRNYEYIHAPNQKHKIYGNNFATNSWSMRSKPLDLQSDTTVILLIGDSVINGGNLTDQDSLASTLLEEWLSQCAKRTIRVLNISAGSWGPDNAAAYLKEQGTFDADAMVLVCSSHDAYDNMTFTEVVGKHPQFPKSQAYFAWEKLWERGWQHLQQYFRKSTKLTEAPAHDPPFNTGFASLQFIASKNGIPLVLFLHPSLQELKTNKMAIMAAPIVQFCDTENISLTKGLEVGADQSHYRDQIHYTEKGQRFLAETLFPVLWSLIREES
jgi:hypothetical protein